MSIPLLFYLILIAAPISILIHELGHAWMASALQAEKVVLSMGSGKKLLTLSQKNLQISIYAVYFLGGVVEHERKRPYSLIEVIWICLSGPIINGIVAFVSYLIYNWMPNEYILLFLLFNIWLSVVNLIPFTFKGKQTDGYTILKEIYSRF